MMAQFGPDELIVSKLRPTKSSCSARKVASLSEPDNSETLRLAATSFSNQEK